MLKEIHRISIFRGGVSLELNGNNYSHIEYGRPPPKPHGQPKSGKCGMISPPPSETAKGQLSFKLRA